jgi:pimeloyl-ACP methyl ester carboxylesterase
MVAVTGISVAVPASAAYGVLGASRTSTRAASVISWGGCPALAAGAARDPRQTCATLQVPQDYRDPSGQTITIMISRIATAKPATRRGVLLTVPGGPGGTGLDLPGAVAAALPAKVFDRYDLIGFDPRGVGHSTPVTCGFHGADLLRDLPYPAPDGSITASVAFASSAAERCAASDSAPLLPFITTANTARDLDRIRAALGEPRLSYFAASYGGYVGAAYAALFPARTDRVVLDSSVDPGHVWYEQYRLLAAGMEDRFPDAARYVIDHGDAIGFGATVEQVRATFLALAARLDTAPVPVPGTAVSLDGNVLRRLSLDLLYQDAQLPTLVQLWRAASRLAATSAVPAVPEDIALVKQLITDHTAPAMAPGVPEGNSLSAKYAVICNDVPWPQDIASYTRNVADDRIRRPLTAGMPANISPCPFWKNRPIESPIRIDSAGPRNIIILQNRRDPATPMESGLGLRRLLGSRAALIEVNGGGHVVLQSGNPCARSLVANFLTLGDLPGHDRSCRQA